MGLRREQIERNIQEAPTLTAIERGHAAAALMSAHHAPHQQLRKVWGSRQASGVAALKARVQDGLSRLRTGLASPDEKRHLEHWRRLQADRAAHRTRELRAPDWAQVVRELHPENIWATHYAKQFAREERANREAQRATEQRQQGVTREHTEPERDPADAVNGDNRTADLMAQKQAERARIADRNREPQ